MKRIRLKNVFLALLVLCFVFFIFTELCILKYLREYGYGIKELPQTTLVYFRLSKGFTVGTNEVNQANIFIGRSEYIYEDVFEKNGYYEADRMGLDGFYHAKDEVKENENTHGFMIYSTRDWCHWFRIYQISRDYPIENF